MRDERQQQLTSAWLNIIAAGVVSGGAVSQLAALANGAPAELCVALAVGCILTGAVLHLAALRCL